ERDPIARQRDDALDEVLIRMLRKWKYDDVAAVNLGGGFIDIEMIPYEYRREHRAGRDLERLDDEASHGHRGRVAHHHQTDPEEDDVPQRRPLLPRGGSDAPRIDHHGRAARDRYDDHGADRDDEGSAR